MLRIAVIGCGIVGSRHAQALGLLDQPATIYLVDPSQDALRRAAALVEQERAAQSPLQVECLTGLDTLPAELDVVVVATAAAARRGLVEALLARGHVRYFVLEKFLFQQRDDYPAIGELMARKGSRAWVNCPRRMWPGYRALKAELVGPIGLTVATYGRFGVGTSAIHLLDVLAFLAGVDSFTLSDAAIDPDPVPHRSGGIDLTGSIFGHGSDGSVFRYTAYASGELPPLTMIDSPHLRAIIDEGGQTMRISRASQNWAWQDETFEIKPQSRLTNAVVESLIADGTCQLADYDESSRLHLAIIDALLQHYHDHVEPGATVCPIT